jgi:predicted MFS family arabinose efflux permease
MADSAPRAGHRGLFGGRLSALLGGPERVRVVVLLAAVLALNSADVGTIGAAAQQLETDLDISHAQLGLLAAASSGVGAIATIPMGVLADRIRRVRLLVATIVVWAIAMVLGGLAPGYESLLLSRLLLGAAVAASGPVVTSLTGDLIPAPERASVLGWILTGEILGAGIGLVIGGEVSAILSWRYAFFLLGLGSLVLAIVLWLRLPEPARGGATPYGEKATDEGWRDQARSTVLAQDVEPVRERVLTADPARMPVLRAMLYLLRIPTNRLLIEASSIGYFFFAGLRTFAVIFIVRHFGISQTTLGALVPIIGVAALAGAVAGGRYTDRILARGHTSARILVPAVGYSAAALLLLPGIWVTSIVIALPLIAIGAAGLTAANPPLDAARLDIVPAAMWGRAEGLRTVLRLAAEAAAPAVFGWLADAFGDSSTSRSSVGLRNAFLIMLIPLLANGLIMIAARRTYAVDVATAVASDDHVHRPS